MVAELESLICVLDKLRETDLLYERAILYGRLAQYDRVNRFKFTRELK